MKKNHHSSIRFVTHFRFFPNLPGDDGFGIKNYNEGKYKAALTDFLNALDKAKTEFGEASVERPMHYMHLNRTSQIQN